MRSGAPAGRSGKRWLGFSRLMQHYDWVQPCRGQLLARVAAGGSPVKICTPDMYIRSHIESSERKSGMQFKVQKYLPVDGCAKKGRLGRVHDGMSRLEADGRAGGGEGTSREYRACDQKRCRLALYRPGRESEGRWYLFRGQNQLAPEPH